jgi:predicted MFS family arabinose efflux permease
MTAPSNASPTRALSTAGIVILGILPFALGYFLSYFFRAVNAVLAPELVRELSLNPEQLGRLTAAYLLAFALFQLPLGVLLDRYGPRRVQACLLMIAALGTLIFSLGQDTLTLTLGRALIGLGFSGGLMASFKAVVVFVPEQRRALASAWIMAAGALGVMVSTAPTQWGVSLFGWRMFVMAIAGVIVLVALTIFFVVPKPDVTTEPQPLKTQLATLWRIIRDPAFLRLAPMLGFTAGTNTAIQTLWAGPWWRDVGGQSAQGMAEMLFLMAVAFFAGSIISGAVADRAQRRGIGPLDVMLGFFAAYWIAQALIIFDLVHLPAWFVFGMMGQLAVLAYPWLSTYFGSALSGRATSAMNLILFATAFIGQWAMGAMIGLFPKTASGGYPLQAYQLAFGTFLALQIIGFLWYLPARRRLTAGAAKQSLN